MSMHLPHLISDLALILLVAGITTLLFKKLNQPLVLGYIVAGFLTGPYLHLTPTVVDMDNISIWSEIGVIFLMFALGLEFSFHKLANVGQTAIILAITEVFGMLLAGFGIGIAMGWSTTDSLILGAVLSMSSTTIIIKAFEELKLKGKKFTELVFGGLIVEDIVGIFIMVFFSTIAVSKGADAPAVVWTIVQLLFYLVLWLLLGIYIIPTLLKKISPLMNNETLLIVSLGVCLGTVLLFVNIGFSVALGAFIAGSILAGTMHSERIEHLTKPIKDLFGAVFFISVGMMVNPAAIVQYAGPIILISLVTIIGKLIFSSLGVLFAGNRLHTAIFCGASLAQIGEFSFIIIQLAIGLQLAGEFIYPVIVSVSVITTFTTPFCIRYAENIYNLVRKLLPDKIHEKLDSYTSDAQTEREKDSHWKQFLRTYFTGLLIYSVVIIGIIQLNSFFIAPFLDGIIHGFGGKLLSTLITLLLMAPFILSLLHQRNKELTLLLIRGRANRLPMIVFMFIRLMIAVFFVMHTVNKFMEIPLLWLILPTLGIIIVMSRFDSLFGRYLQIEARFLANFNERQLTEWALNEKGASIGSWLSDELWVAQYRFEQDSSRGNMLSRVLCSIKGTGSDAKLSDLIVRRFYSINIIKIISRKKHINLPENTQKLHEGDVLFLLGTKSQVDSFRNDANHPNMTEQVPPITLRSFIVNQDCEHEEQQLLCFAINVDKSSDFAGKSIKDSGIRKKWNCFIFGLQRDIYPIVYPNIQTIIRNGDRIWVLGSQKMFNKLVQSGLIEADLEMDLERDLERDLQTTD